MEDNKQQVPLFKQNLSKKKKFVELAKYVTQAMSDSNVTMASKAITYYILLSLFPAVIVVGNFIPLLHLDKPTVIEYIGFILPDDLHHYLLPTITKVLSNSNTGVLSVGIIVALWAISRGLNIVQMTMNEAYGLDVDNLFTNQTLVNFIIRRGLAFFMTLMLLLIGVAAIVTFTFGQAFLHWLMPLLNIDPHFVDIFVTWKWPLAIVIMFLIVFALFYFLPNIHLKLKHIITGTVITSVGLLGLSQLFSYYLKYFGSAWNNYGTIGAIIVFLLWMNMSVTIFLFGNAVNVGFAEAYEGPFLRKNTGRLTSYLQSQEKGE
ncbi:YihY/virulence factor BrkB family protein [Lactobacillus halodurans]|uniref:YihY/virulence factor BrkB family protein n=1 Tax=Companilactobacillus halodurans TaxID=2584183 RepID=A0A5P0ZQ03_9LACO|nr:YihY/virulence factor BrkB family protein [Companilactobacillus halodurans]MQS75941.1 YihY/virulence factor BrkB family protein [Companilactobacillus halodurans]